MDQRGWPTCPYVNPMTDIPDDGLVEFLEVPRFSTGFTALHHIIGFMPETHMLKPFADRYDSMRALVESVMAFTVANGAHIKQLRAAAKAEGRTRAEWPVMWQLDETNPATFRFKGYAAKRHASVIGNYTRLSYDRAQPWERDIKYYNSFPVSVAVRAPTMYVVPQQWREVIERLQWNGVQMTRVEQATTVDAQYYHIVAVTSRPTAYEGHMFHDEVQVEARNGAFALAVGDYLVPLDQDNARYAVETLEPQGHDSFFRWVSSTACWKRRKRFPITCSKTWRWRCWKPSRNCARNSTHGNRPTRELLANQDAVLTFIFHHGKRHAEPEWRRYPVLSVF